MIPSDVVVAKIKRQLMGAAQDAYPEEACGFITFDGRMWTARNLLARSTLDGSLGVKRGPEFAMNPEDVLMMWPHAAAIWHSHPTGRLDPSSVDRLWHPDHGATGQALGMVIVTCEDVNVAVPW